MLSPPLDQLLLALADSTAERCALLFSSSTHCAACPFHKQERQRISARFCFCWQEQVALDERRKSFGYGAAGHGTTGVVLTTVLILCHDEPGHMVGRRGAKHFGGKRREL